MSVFLSYPGGKARMAAQIVERMQPHSIYVEPFCGTAAVLLNKPRVAFEMINDVDREVVTLMRVVRDQPDELARALALTPYSRQEYKDADPKTADDDLEIARRTAVRIGQSFAKVGLADHTKGWRVSVRGGRACGLTWADVPDKILQACDRLRGVHIENGPALGLIERYGVEPDGLLYVDPPYVGTTRARAIYAHEMGDESDHRALAEALSACKAHVLLSGYHSPLYDEMYEAWPRAEFRAVANHNGNSGADVQRVEVLWSNRPLDRHGSLFDPAAVAA